MSTLYREWIEALSTMNWENFPDEKLKLESGKWNWMVLVKFENKDNQWLPQQALVKVVGLVDSQSDEWNKLIQPDLSQTPLNATSDYVFDPFGVAVLRGGEGKKESVLLENLGLLPTDQLFVQTYSWKISEKRWNLVGSLPFVPPMEVGGICWDGKYLDDYYLSAVRFPDAMEGVLIATLRLGIVVGEYKWDSQHNNFYDGRLKMSIERDNDDKWKIKIEDNEVKLEREIAFKREKGKRESVEAEPDIALYLGK